MRRAACLALLVLAAIPVAAWADSKLFINGGVFYFVSEDAGIGNRIVGDTDGRGRMHLVDEADPAGMKFPAPPCTPGKINGSGNPVEVFCDRDATYRSVSVTSGPVEDRVDWRINDLAVTISGEAGADVLTAAGAADTLSGGQGNDALDGGAGNDTVRGDEGDDQVAGGPGDDTLNGGPGVDTFAGGEGNDTLQTSDGYADSVDCGPGDDTAVVDQLDTPANCERLTTQQVTPVPGQSGPKDTAAPTLQIGGSTSQRAAGKVKLLATASEPAEVNLSGYLQAGGLNTLIKPTRAQITVGGGGASLTVALSARGRKLVRRSLRQHRKPRLRLTVTAADAAGNTSAPRHISIALR